MAKAQFKSRKIKQVDSTSSQRESRFLLLGNRLCVDFANTAYNPIAGDDPLHSFRDVLDFLEASGEINKADAASLRSFTRQHPRKCEAAFAEALEIRRALLQILFAMAAGKKVQVEWVKPINSILRVCAGHEELTENHRGWQPVFVTRADQARQALSLVARSAIGLLADREGPPIHKCANPACNLYFCDFSRTRRRRWCSMKVCGNRAKVTAYARRLKKSRAGERRRQQVRNVLASLSYYRS